MNIYEKMLAIATEISTVQKDLEVGTGKASYKAVGEASVLRAVKPLEKKYGIYSYPVHRTIIESGTIENEALINGEKIVKRNLFERIEVTYRFVNTEKPDEYIDIVSYGDGVDSQDKSVGKAMTYADKYALMKAYKLVTGDDPDKEPSGELKQADIKKNETLDKALLDKCKKLNITLEKIAIVFEKNINQITNEDLEKAIKQQEEAIKRNYQKKAE